MDERSRLTEFEELYIEVQRKISHEWRSRLERYLSVSQGIILKKLQKEGPQKATVLAERLNITPGAITSLSDKLIASGYATRERDKEDRRVVHLRITEKGEEILNHYRIEIKNAISEIFAGLPEEDIRHMIRIYERVLKNIDKK